MIVPACISWATPKPQFAFCMSILAGTALAMFKGHLQAVRGQDMVAEMSIYALVNNAAEVYSGMMMAVPPQRWSFLCDCSVAPSRGTAV